MEEARDRIVSSPREAGAVEERMLGTELVREIVARKERGEGVKRIARELGVDRKTVKRWLKRVFDLLYTSRTLDRADSQGHSPSPKNPSAHRAGPGRKLRGKPRAAQQ
jgi:DNA-binding NarL/FixJ family response regulator